MIDPHTTRLRAWYEGAFIALYHADAAPRTIESYATTVAAWERCTPDPPLAKIDQITLAQFRAAFANKATASKHCRQLNALLAKLGPPGPRNRDALGLLDASLWTRPSRADQKTPTVPTDDDVVRMLDAPSDLALFAVTAALIGSRASAIRALTPDAVDHREQLIHLPATTDKRRRSRIKPAPTALLHWWKAYPDAWRRWRVTRSAFARRWNRHAAKLGAQSLRPHALKRWWAAQLVRTGASAWAVKYALDHAQRDVTGIHYLSPLDELSSLVDKIELPPRFHHPRGMPDDSQLTFGFIAEAEDPPFRQPTKGRPK